MSDEEQDKTQAGRSINTPGGGGTSPPSFDIMRWLADHRDITTWGVVPSTLIYFGAAVLSRIEVLNILLKDFPLPLSVALGVPIGLLGRAVWRWWTSDLQRLKRLRKTVLASGLSAVEKAECEKQLIAAMMETIKRDANPPSRSAP